MPDVVIPEVPRAVLAALDAAASRAGLSRAHYLRRLLEDAAGQPTSGLPPTEVLRLSPPADPADDSLTRIAWT